MNREQITFFCRTSHPIYKGLGEFCKNRDIDIDIRATRPKLEDLGIELEMCRGPWLLECAAPMATRLVANCPGLGGFTDLRVLGYLDRYVLTEWGRGCILYLQKGKTPSKVYVTSTQSMTWMAVVLYFRYCITRRKKGSSE